MKGLFSFKRVTLLLLVFFMVQALLLPTAAKEVTSLPLPQVSGASSIYLYHYESDQVLLKRSSLKQLAPASTVKIMTGIVALEMLQDRLDEKVTVTEEMLAGAEGFKIHLEPKMTVTVRDLLYGVICAGGNDAAEVLAIVCSGSVERFVEQMNEKATAIGCTSTHYTNPCGMDEAQMTTTLEDVIRISKEAIRNEPFMAMASCPQYTVATPQKTLTLYNRNALISTFSAAGYQNRYVKGLNAGMTDRGGYCTVAYAEKENNSYLCVVMGAAEQNGKILSYQIVNQLLNFVFDTYSYQTIAEKGTSLCTAPLRYALPESGKETAELTCVLGDDLLGFLPRNIDEDALVYQTFLHHDTLTAPIEKGTVVGGVDVYYEDQYIASAKLIARESVSANSTLLTLGNMKRIILSRVFWISLISAILLSAVYFLFLDRKKLSSKSKK